MVQRLIIVIWLRGDIAQLRGELIDLANDIQHLADQVSRLRARDYEDARQRSDLDDSIETLKSVAAGLLETANAQETERVLSRVTGEQLQRTALALGKIELHLGTSSLMQAALVAEIARLHNDAQVISQHLAEISRTLENDWMVVLAGAMVGGVFTLGATIWGAKRAGILAAT